MYLITYLFKALPSSISYNAACISSGLINVISQKIFLEQQNSKNVCNSHKLPTLLPVIVNLFDIISKWFNE